jgi:hypothetical protein
MNLCLPFPYLPQRLNRCGFFLLGYPLQAQGLLARTGTLVNNPHHSTLKNDAIEQL